MTRAEDHLAGKLDRDAAKEKRTARSLQVREMAVAVINCAVMEQPEEDRAEFMREGIRHLRTLYGAGEGEHEARNLFAALSKTPANVLRQAVCGAEAERIAQTLFRSPANENSGGEG